MKKYLDRILLTVLCATTILLALTFWLNTKFGFNLFSAAHWHQLSVLQASKEPIYGAFYLSIGIAILMFIICLNIIYRPKRIKITPPIAEQHPVIQPEQTNTSIQKQIEDDKPTPPQTTPPEPDQTPTTPSAPHLANPEPPRLHLNLPKNMAQIAAARYAEQKPNTSLDHDKFDTDLDKIFSENQFLVKKKPTISGLKLNLFAIGANEVVWMGGVNCDLDKLKEAIARIENVFSETLEDIPITVNAFVIDTLKRYNSDSRIHIFHTIDELNKYISENPGGEILDSGRSDFDAYSDYIDTVLTLLYKS